MKDWQAFLDLKKKIDDFNETSPLLEMMTNKAMAERHWLRISALTKKTFDIESDTFTLGLSSNPLLPLQLLQYAEILEFMCKPRSS